MATSKGLKIKIQYFTKIYKIWGKRKGMVFQQQLKTSENAVSIWYMYGKKLAVFIIILQQPSYV